MGGGGVRRSLESSYQVACFEAGLVTGYILWYMYQSLVPVFYLPMQCLEWHFVLSLERFSYDLEKWFR